MYSKQLLRLASTGLRNNSFQATRVVPKSFSLMGHQSLQIRSFSPEAKSERVQKISEEILALSTLEMNQLIIALQTKLGVSDAMLAGVGTAQAPGAGKAAEAAAPAPEPEKVKDVFGIKIGAVDAKAKIKIIKEVRTITGLGLKEAKELVEKAPVTIKEGLKKDEAEAFKKLLVEAGATVELL